MLDKNEENYKNLSTSRAKRAFQLRLKTFFTIFEGFYVGEMQKLAGTSLDRSYEIF